MNLKEVKDCKCNKNGICVLGTGKLPCQGQLCSVKEL